MKCKKCGEEQANVYLNANGLCEECVKKEKLSELVVCKECKETIKKDLLSSNGLCFSCDKAKNLKNTQMISANVVKSNTSNYWGWFKKAWLVLSVYLMWVVIIDNPNDGTVFAVPFTIVTIYVWNYFFVKKTE